MAAEFTLDTSGEVELTANRNQPALYTWSDLSPFAQGYVEGMKAWRRLIAYPVPPQERSEQGDLDFHDWRFSDLSPEALAMILRDCEAYLSAAEFRFPNRDLGGKFWNYRQRGGMPVTFPPLTVSLNDEGKVCLRERDQ